MHTYAAICKYNTIVGQDMYVVNVSYLCSRRDGGLASSLGGLDTSLRGKYEVLVMYLVRSLMLMPSYFGFKT